MNFNFNSQPEHTLNTSLAEEMIRLYGVLTTFMITQKINADENVFGDYSHMKTDNDSSFSIYMLPENTEDWDNDGLSMTSFGLVNFDNVSLFVAKSSFDINGFNSVDDITGNLIMFPNNKIMEITNTDFVVPGINNLFTYSDTKTVYKISCKPYDFKLVNEVNIPETNDTLDSYFQELVDRSDSVDEEVAETPQVKVIENEVKKVKPIVDKTEDDVWGKLF